MDTADYINTTPQDGKRYINTMLACKCCGKRGNSYYLKCDIPGCKEKYFLYDDAAKSITANNDPEISFFVAEKAATSAAIATDDFDLMMCETGDWEKLKVTVKDRKTVIRYTKTNRSTFNYILEYEECEKTLDYVEDVNLNHLREHLLALTKSFFPDGEEYKLFERDLDDLTKSPLYIAVNKLKDGNFWPEKSVMTAMVKQAYARIDEKDAAFLGSQFHDRFLPVLPAKFDRYYVVDAFSIDKDMLKRSGYSMDPLAPEDEPGYTESKWMLDPATLTVVDKAPSESDAISFQEYLEMFDTPTMRELFRLSEFYKFWTGDYRHNGCTQYEASEKVKEIILSMSNRIKLWWIKEKPWYDDDVVWDIAGEEGEDRFKAMVKKGDMRTSEGIDGYMWRITN
ncbi:MAG: hypothetical protein K6G89_07930 [Clostridia bacterium]|nr:hypothetical protein [Clostridia bacterium]